MTSYTVLTAADTSIDLLLEAINEAYSDYFVPVDLTRRALHLLLARESVVLEESPIAVLDNRVIGMVLLGMRGERGWIGGVGVIPSFRRRSIARHLMTEAIRRAKDLSLKSLQLEVIVENEGAILLYESLGFSVQRDLFVMSRESSRLPEMPSDERLFRKFLLSRKSPCLGWLESHYKVPPPWQREREALWAERQSLRGIALVSDNPEKVKGMCLYQEVNSDIDIKTLEADDVKSGGLLLNYLLHQCPLAFSSIVNVPEDDPMQPVFRRFGYRTVLIQHEMKLGLSDFE